LERSERVVRSKADRPVEPGLREVPRVSRTSGDYGN
jgi:hypothetical protein